jgi:DNA-binding response OmpR family regulator
MDPSGERCASAAATTARYKILVINDSPDFLAFMREFLSVEGGFEVATLDQSEGVIKQVTSAPPDLIVLDIVFRSGPTGLQVAEALSNAAETANIPVLFCTALSERDIDAETRDLAAAHNQRILYKPFDVDDLLRDINELLERTYGPNAK